MRRGLLCIVAIVIAGFSAVSFGAWQQPESGVITGRVFMADGGPAIGVRVAALSPPPTANAQPPSNPAVISRTETDREGRYRLENIPPGSYWLAAGPLDAPFYYSGGAAQNEPLTVNVTAGASVVDRDFHLNAVKVSGQVIRDGHNAGTTVLLTMFNVPGPAATLSAPIAPDGSFEFPLARVGEYRVSINTERAMIGAGAGGRALRAIDPGTALTTLTVADKNIEGLKIDFPRSSVRDSVVTFVVDVEGGGQIPLFRLSFVPVGPASNSQLERTIPALSSISLPLGEYRVRLPLNGGNLPAGYFIKSMTTGTVDLQKETLKVTGAIQAIRITLGASPSLGVKLTGRVTGIEKVAEPAREIQIIGKGIRTPLIATVGLDGSFEFPRVLPGPYLATLTPSADPFDRRFVVDPVDPKILLIPMAVPVLQVSGRVEVRADRLREGIQGWLRPPRKGPTNGDPFSNPVDDSVVLVNPDGTFSFKPVEPGKYVLSFSTCVSDFCPGREDSKNVSLVVDKDITNMVVRLNFGPPPKVSNRRSTPPPAWVPISGTVSVAGGAPLPQFKIRFYRNHITQTATITGPTFSTVLQEGDQQVTILDLPPGYVVKEMKFGNSDARKTLKVKAATANTAQRSIAITLSVVSPPPQTPHKPVK